MEAEGLLSERRRRNLFNEVLGLATMRLRAELEASLREDPEVQGLLDEVVARRLDPASAAARGAGAPHALLICNFFVPIRPRRAGARGILGDAPARPPPRPDPREFDVDPAIGDNVELDRRFRAEIDVAVARLATGQEGVVGLEQARGAA